MITTVEDLSMISVCPPPYWVVDIVRIGHCRARTSADCQHSHCLTLIANNHQNYYFVLVLIKFYSTFHWSFHRCARVTEDFSVSPLLLCKVPSWSLSPRRRTPRNSSRSWQREQDEPARTSSILLEGGLASTQGVPLTNVRLVFNIIEQVSFTQGDRSSCRLRKHPGQAWYSDRWWRGWRSW